MYQFIVVLRALAAVIITNAHYENIYPLSIIANGGLLGDVIFFAISGFCLYKPRQRFVPWYAHRLKRVYTPVWIITIIYLFLGFYKADSIMDYIKLLLYPTYYHFIASLLILYIVYYMIIKLLEVGLLGRKKNLYIFLSVVFALQFTIYIMIYDKSYYHIDSVYEPMIRFVFFEAMIIGSIVRENMKQLLNNRSKITVWLIFPLFLTYFASKMIFLKYTQLAKFQIVNQVVLLLLLTIIFIAFCSFENKICIIPQKIYGFIRYISSITLEIYLVQYALISRFNIGRFPLNFMIVTGLILITASALHFASQKINKIDVLNTKRKTK